MKIAICPGSFDPLTKGHLDIIKRTAKMLDKVIVVVMHNYHKTNYYFSAAERVELLSRCTKDLNNVSVDMHGGLLAEYAREKGAVAIVKGLRAVSDYMYLSSSVVKQVCEFGGDVSDFVPAEVCDDIIKRIKERSSLE